MKTRDIFKKNLNKLMKENNITRDDLSKAINEPYTSIREWDTGSSFPRDSKIDKICKYFNIKSYELFKEEQCNTENDFKTRVKELRVCKNLTQEQLAKKLNVSRSNVANWENGSNTATQEMLNNLSDFFNCSTDYLLGRTNCRNAEKELIELKQNILSLVNGNTNDR